VTEEIVRLAAAGIDAREDRRAKVSTSAVYIRWKSPDGGGA
jgi:hypothetical protein